jgi:hypothetical protein
MFEMSYPPPPKKKSKYMAIFVYLGHQGAQVHYGIKLRTFINTSSFTYGNMHHWKSCKFSFILVGPAIFKVKIVITLLVGYTVAQLVEALRYKPEGCGLDSRWSHWNFSVT